MKYTYNFPDEEMQQGFREFTDLQNREIIKPVETSYREDIAALIVAANRVLNSKEESDFDYDKCKLFLEILKVKLAIIVEERKEIDRAEKRRHLKNVPVEHFFETIRQCTNLMIKYIDEEKLPVAMSEMTLLMNKAEKLKS